MSDSVRPHRPQPTRLPCPWDSPSKNTGVGCHFLLQCMKVKSESEVAQSFPTLSDPMDCNLPGSSVRGFSRQEYWSGMPLPSLLSSSRSSQFTEADNWLKISATNGWPQVDSFCPRQRTTTPANTCFAFLSTCYNNSSHFLQTPCFCSYRMTLFVPSCNYYRAFSFYHILRLIQTAFTALILLTAR